MSDIKDVLVAVFGRGRLVARRDGVELWKLGAVVVYASMDMEAVEYRYAVYARDSYLGVVYC